MPCSKTWQLLLDGDAAQILLRAPWTSVHQTQVGCMAVWEASYCWMM